MLVMFVLYHNKHYKMKDTKSLYNVSMNTKTMTRSVVEVTETARQQLKTVASHQGKTMKALMQEIAEREWKAVFGTIPSTAVSETKSAYSTTPASEASDEGK